jgi:hypothetical protein
MMELTKERLQQIVHAAGLEPWDYEEVFDGITTGEIVMMARQLLASMEREPVAYMHRNGVSLMWAGDLDAKFKVKKGGWSPLYAAPQLPQPAVVPDEVIVFLNHLEDVLPYEAFNLIDVKTWNNVSMLSRPEVYRAAMLQGAENAGSRCTIQTAPALDSLPKNPESRSGNSPVIPGGWIACSERMPEETGDIIVVSDGIVMSGISYSRKKGFYLQALEYDADEPVDDVTHWMPLPAAPQQEVK